VESGQETVLGMNGLMFEQGLSHWISGLPGDRDAEDSKDEAGVAGEIEGLEASRTISRHQMGVVARFKEAGRFCFGADIYSAVRGHFTIRLENSTVAGRRLAFAFVSLLFGLLASAELFGGPDIAKQVDQNYFRSCDGG